MLAAKAREETEKSPNKVISRGGKFCEQLQDWGPSWGSSSCRGGVRGRLPSELSPAWVSQAREHRQGERQRQRLGAGEELGAVEER